MQSLGRSNNGRRLWVRKCGVCFFSVTLRSGGLCVRRGAQFERSLRRVLWINFDAVFNLFSEGTAVLEALYSYHDRR